MKSAEATHELSQIGSQHHYNGPSDLYWVVGWPSSESSDNREVVIIHFDHGSYTGVRTARHQCPTSCCFREKSALSLHLSSCLINRPFPCVNVQYIKIAFVCKHVCPAPEWQTSISTMKKLRSTRCQRGFSDFQWMLLTKRLTSPCPSTHLSQRSGEKNKKQLKLQTMCP